jgi:hypothetical protein
MRRLPRASDDPRHHAKTQGGGGGSLDNFLALLTDFRAGEAKQGSGDTPLAPRKPFATRPPNPRPKALRQAPNTMLAAFAFAVVSNLQPPAAGKRQALPRHWQHWQLQLASWR